MMTKRKGPSQTFSFRWGVPLLDSKFTIFPNHFFRVYSQAITKDEWLYVCHLATYKHETESAECRPSQVTVAHEMGYQDVRSVQRLRAKLEGRSHEGRPLLRVIVRPGQENIYDFGGLSSLLLGLEPRSENARSEEPRNLSAPTSQGGDRSVTSDKSVTPRQESHPPGDSSVAPTGDMSVTGVVTPASPKKNKKDLSTEEKLDHMWEICLDELEQQMQRSVYYQWLHDTKLLSIDRDSNVAVVSVRTQYAVEWLTYRLYKPVTRMLQGVSRIDNLEIEFIVVPEEPRSEEKPAPTNGGQQSTEKVDMRF